jgi:hypothetical protein
LADNEDNQTLRLASIAGAGLVIVIAALLLYWLGISRRSESPSALAEEQRAYLQQIVVSGPHMSAADNFLGHTVTYLDAQMTNKGTRTVNHVQLEMEFVDMLGQVVLRETNRPVNAQTPALKPGETRTFQVSFEHMPLEWNQAPPRIGVKLVAFR